MINEAVVIWKGCLGKQLQHDRSGRCLTNSDDTFWQREQSFLVNRICSGKKRVDEWLMANLSTHRVPVTCDTQSVQSIRFWVCNFAFSQWVQRNGVQLSSKPEGFQIKYCYWPAGRFSCTSNSIVKAIFSTWVLKIGREPAFLIDHKLIIRFTN